MPSMGWTLYQVLEIHYYSLSSQSIYEIAPSIPILQVIKLRFMNIKQLVNITELVTDRTQIHIQTYLVQNTYFSLILQYTAFWDVCVYVCVLYLFSFFISCYYIDLKDKGDIRGKDVSINLVVILSLHTIFTESRTLDRKSTRLNSSH